MAHVFNGALGDGAIPSSPHADVCSIRPLNIEKPILDEESGETDEEEEEIPSGEIYCAVFMLHLAMVALMTCSTLLLLETMVNRFVGIDHFCFSQHVLSLACSVVFWMARAGSRFFDRYILKPRLIRTMDWSLALCTVCAFSGFAIACVEYAFLHAPSRRGEDMHGEPFFLPLFPSEPWNLFGLVWGFEIFSQACVFLYFFVFWKIFLPSLPGRGDAKESTEEHHRET